MKKTLLILGVIGMIFMASCSDDTTTPGTNEEQGRTFLASTSQEKKAAVLEDFTGVRCGFCPQGHQIANTLLDTYGDKMIVLGVNAGSYAAPRAGWADFTTAFGQELINQSAVAGYPAGTVNRVQFPRNQKGGLAMSRGDWTNAAETIMAQDAPVNVGVEASFDEATRELTVYVDLYYTSEVTKNSNINVVLLQSGMIAKQSGGGDNYEHKHVVRDFITGQWGEEVDASETTEGAKITKKFTYTVPTDYNGATIPPGGGEVVIDDCEIAVFVAQGRTEIMNGARAKITK